MSFSSGADNLFQLNHNEFDFNVQFEQLFFSILPSILFIASSSWRTIYQARKPIVVDAPVFRLVKMAAFMLYTGLDITLLVLVAVDFVHVTRMFVAASALKLVSTLFMIALSLVDHSKSLRPSVLLNSYLFLTLLLDAAQARTLFLSSYEHSQVTYSCIFTAAVALKVGILLLEAQQKSRWLLWKEKELSPEETSGVISLGIFAWLNKLFMIGYAKILTIDDLYPLDRSLEATALHEQFVRKMANSKTKGDKWGLVKVLARTLKVPLLLPIPARLALLGFTMCQPFFIQSLVNYLAKPDADADANVGYGLIGASAIIYAGIATSTAFSWYFHHRMRTMVRSILVTEIYRKAVDARIGVGDDSAALTLMSTDMERINMGFRSLHDTWASIIQVALAAWLLYGQLGAAFISPLAVVFVSLGGLMILLKFVGKSQKSWMTGVQKRVGMTATVISSMKNLKMSGLAAVAQDFVQQLRTEELAAGSQFRTIILAAAIIGFVPMTIGPVFTFALASRKLDAARIFTSLSYLLLLTQPLSQIFQFIPDLLTGLACLSRVQSFLECETRNDFRCILADATKTGPQSEKNSPSITMTSLDHAYHLAQEGAAHPVSVKDGRFGWTSHKPALQNINTQVSKSSLTIVVGSVGSGKSTFCKALLGEIPFSEGYVMLSTPFPRVAYCDQTAFLSNGTVKDNIIGFSTFNPERYTDVVEATSLRFDFETLPHGDKTIIGSDGITLSGGQKQRISLARALYLHSDLLVLDDVFSGLDADTEDQVFRKVFAAGGLLKRRGSTVILCTHSIRHIPMADHIIVLEDRTILEQGSFDQLMANHGYVHRLKLKTYGGEKTSNDAASDEQTEASTCILPTNQINAPSDSRNTNVSRQTGDKTVYKHYFKSMGLDLAAWSLFLAVLLGFFLNFPTIWLSYWSDDVSSGHMTRSSAFYIGVYAMLQVSALISIFLLGIAIWIVSMRRAGAHMHRDALQTLIRAPLSFFTSTDTGVVTNLFSQDLNLVDTELPSALLNVLIDVFEATGQAAVMLTASPYIAISYPFLAILLYIIQKFYLRTSRQLRLLDLETKSPLYTHFLDTVKGIVTLRAFGFVPQDIDKNACLVDASQRPAYLLVMIQQWLNLVLDLVVMVMAVVLTTLAVRLRSHAGFAGASLVTLMSFGASLSGIVINYTKLETSIGAIARLRTFNETVKPEDRDDEDVVPPEQWPEHGAIELKNVSASYKEQDPTGIPSNLALRNINLKINAGEKIAICGRTGSGKSSLVALLLKLLDPSPATADEVATIDDTPIRRIERSTLRQRILAVPQEAVFLPDGCTFRANLDPSNTATPEQCQVVLIAVGLWDFVVEHGGLQAEMSASKFSAGQRQLMSLGRVLLRRRIRAGLPGTVDKGGILLLDEVSSSVDHETERVMQEIIRSEFRAYTVIAVSHRLDMIMDFDRVVVMDTGAIAEVGVPKILSQQVGTRFGELVKAGGMREEQDGDGSNAI